MKRRIVFFIAAAGAALFLFGAGFVWFSQTVFSYLDNDGGKAEKADYQAYVQLMFASHDKDFVGYKEYGAYDGDVKAIALYLPQYHPFAENSRWHGQGFTEWFNVTAAKPLFAGHYQPKLPIDVGFYDLSHTDVMRRQIELAKNYGIGGFAFYYYWFAGKKLMEKPVYNFLADKTLDFPFCLHWANESWTKRWDGGSGEVLINQTFSKEDFEPLARDLLAFFKDERYIKIDGRPLFIIYRPGAFGRELMAEFAAYLRKYAVKNGIKAPYIVGTKAFGFWEDPDAWGLDAVMEFEINNIFGLEEMDTAKIDEKADFRRFDWAGYILAGKEKLDYKYKTFRTVFPAWDNTARKAYTGALVFDGTSPEIYGRWLDFAVNDTKKKFKDSERILFINAWNEWAEGAYLEPDRRYGYAYLDMTRNVLDGKAAFGTPEAKPAGIAVLTGGRNRIAKGFELLNLGKGVRMLISGVQPGTTIGAIAAREDVKFDGQPVELGYYARDTKGNAKEIKDWAQKYGFGTIYAVTSFYHVPRASLELLQAMPGADIRFVAAGSEFVRRDWWRSFSSFKFLMFEYTKFLAVAAQYKIWARFLSLFDK